ncbi:MAG: PKD domain-containing protein, partial [Candidatus Bathyarchaeales archaeon]
TDTYTLDENIEENDEERIDGYYEIMSTVANHLEVSPPSIVLPEIAGDKIVGEKFYVDILMENISATDDIILVQWEMYYNSTVLNCTDIIERDFMNNTTWAPYGTLFSWVVDKYDDTSRITCFTLINTNPDTGEWDWTERPEGSGKIATIEFEILHQPRAPESVTLPLNLGGIFGEFFLNTTIEYVPYGPPLNGTFTLNGYNYEEPVADFSFPEPVEVNKTVTFNASASYGFRNVNGTLVPDSTYIKEYKWNFGDGNITTTTNPIINHTYSNVGAYTVNLTVVDYDGLTNSTTKSFVVYEIISHTVTYETHSFTVITASTGKIEKDSIVLIQKHRCLYFNVTGEAGALAIVNITIPNELLKAMPEDWMVIVKGSILTTTNGLIVTTVDSEHTMLSMQFTFGSKEPVFIFGTSVVPEFSNLTMTFATILMLTAASIIFASKKFRK